MTFKILAAAGLVALATIPVMAQAADGRPDTTTNTSADAAASKKKFCVVEAATGSRVPKKICRTRTEWLALGFDPTAK